MRHSIIQFGPIPEGNRQHYTSLLAVVRRSNLDRLLLRKALKPSCSCISHTYAKKSWSCENSRVNCEAPRSKEARKRKCHHKVSTRLLTLLLQTQAITKYILPIGNISTVSSQPSTQVCFKPYDLSCTSSIYVCLSAIARLGQRGTGVVAINFKNQEAVVSVDHVARLRRRSI